MQSRVREQAEASGTQFVSQSDMTRYTLYLCFPIKTCDLQVTDNPKSWSSPSTLMPLSLAWLSACSYALGAHAILSRCAGMNPCMSEVVESSFLNEGTRLLWSPRSPAPLRTQKSENSLWQQILQTCLVDGHTYTQYIPTCETSNAIQGCERPQEEPALKWVGEGCGLVCLWQGVATLTVVINKDLHKTPASSLMIVAVAGLQCMLRLYNTSGRKAITNHQEQLLLLLADAVLIPTEHHLC